MNRDRGTGSRLHAKLNHTQVLLTRSSFDDTTVRFSVSCFVYCVIQNGPRKALSHCTKC